MLVVCTASALKIRSLPRVEVGTDTGKRMIRAQSAVVSGTSLDGEWLYVDAPAGRGWTSKAYLETIEAHPSTFVADPAWPKVPHGYSEIVRIFGTPGSAPCSAGRVELPAPLKLAWSEEEVRIVSCHKLLEDVFTSVFAQIYDRGLWDELENFGGIYNSRTITSSQKISTHSWGISGDFDTLDNPLGKSPRMHPTIVAIFDDHGFQWGGKWNRPDGMHFQYATGY